MADIPYRITGVARDALNATRDKLMKQVLTEMEGGDLASARLLQDQLNAVNEALQQRASFADVMHQWIEGELMDAEEPLPLGNLLSAEDMAELEAAAGEADAARLAEIEALDRMRDEMEDIVQRMQVNVGDAYARIDDLVEDDLGLEGDSADAAIARIRQMIRAQMIEDNVPDFPVADEDAEEYAAAVEAQMAEDEAAINARIAANRAATEAAREAGREFEDPSLEELQEEWRRVHAGLPATEPEPVPAPEPAGDAAAGDAGFGDVGFDGGELGDIEMHDLENRLGEAIGDRADAGWMQAAAGDADVAGGVGEEAVVSALGEAGGAEGLGGLVGMVASGEIFSGAGALALGMAAGEFIAFALIGVLASRTYNILKNAFAGPSIPGSDHGTNGDVRLWRHWVDANRGKPKSEDGYAVVAMQVSPEDLDTQSDRNRRWRDQVWKGLKAAAGEVPSPGIDLATRLPTRRHGRDLVPIPDPDWIVPGGPGIQLPPKGTVIRFAGSLTWEQLWEDGDMTTRLLIMSRKASIVNATLRHRAAISATLAKAGLDPMLQNRSELYADNGLQKLNTNVWRLRDMTPANRALVMHVMQMHPEYHKHIIAGGQGLSVGWIDQVQLASLSHATNFGQIDYRHKVAEAHEDLKQLKMADSAFQHFLDKYAPWVIQHAMFYKVLNPKFQHTPYPVNLSSLTPMQNFGAAMCLATLTRDTDTAQRHSVRRGGQMEVRVVDFPTIGPDVLVIALNAPSEWTAINEQGGVSVTFPDGRATVMSGVMRGVNSAWRLVHESLRLRPFALPRRIYLTGHGMAGGIAEVLSALWSKDLAGPYADSEVITITFGAPRVGDSTFRAINTRRVVHHVVLPGDAMANAPTRAQGYVRSGALMKYCDTYTVATDVNDPPFPQAGTPQPKPLESYVNAFVRLKNPLHVFRDHTWPMDAVEHFTTLSSMILEAWDTTSVDAARKNLETAVEVGVLGKGAYAAWDYALEALRLGDPEIVDGDPRTANQMDAQAHRLFDPPPISEQHGRLVGELE